jgi:hypothetical protein
MGGGVYETLFKLEVENVFLTLCGKCGKLYYLHGVKVSWGLQLLTPPAQLGAISCLVFSPFDPFSLISDKEVEGGRGKDGKTVEMK